MNRNNESFMIPIMDELTRIIDSRLKISFNGMLMVDDLTSDSPAPVMCISFDDNDFVVFIVNKSKDHFRFALDHNRVTKVSIEDPELIEKLAALMPYEL